MKIEVPVGATKKKKRVGRGSSSGLGKTSGRGTKGQKARNKVRAGFEGGQMPLYRRVARRGFSNIPFKKVVSFVHIADLNRYFNAGDIVNLQSLKDKRLVKKTAKNVKILADGEIDKSLTIQGLLFSASAAAKLTKSKCVITEQQGSAADKENTADKRE